MRILLKFLLVTSLVLMLPMGALTPLGIDTGAAFAQKTKEAKPKRKTKRTQSIPASLVKDFEKIQVAFDEEDFTEAEKILTKIETKKDLNNISKAYIYNYRGNIAFNKDDLNSALVNFKKILALKEGLNEQFYNQIVYVVAQVYFSQENYREALTYANRWFKLQTDPSADAYMLIGQAHYGLGEYDKSLPFVKQGIDKYIELGSVPKEGWLNLLSGIYREKKDYKNMLPVLKQLVKHYPKKTYLLTMGGVYNELDDLTSMTGLYQSMYDYGLLDKEGELISLASLQLQSSDSPYQAAIVMQKGLESGVIKDNLKNNQIYSQALYLAKEYEQALAPLTKAAKQSKNGKLYDQLAQSYIALNRWKEAEAAFEKAIKKGGLASKGQTLLSQGSVYFELKKFKQAKNTFIKVKKYPKLIKAANNWIKYVDNEVFRINELKKEIVIERNAVDKVDA